MGLAVMNAAPLERIYQNRCYDCLAPVPVDDVLCESCKKDHREARRG